MVIEQSDLMEYFNLKEIESSFVDQTSIAV